MNITYMDKTYVPAETHTEECKAAFQVGMMVGALMGILTFLIPFILAQTMGK